MAWSSFAHLPTTEEEYYYVLSHLKNDMSIKDVDKIIADYKGKADVTHHYRANYARLGLFVIKAGQITLNYDVEKLCNDRSYLKDVLTHTLNSDILELNQIHWAVVQEQTYDVKMIADVIKTKDVYIAKSSLIRWIRPVLFLLQFVNVLLVEEENLILFQKAYLCNNVSFGEVVTLEEVEKNLKQINESLNIVCTLEELLKERKNRYKIELLMMPDWATKSTSYYINHTLYTHIKIKCNLLREEE